MAVQRLIRLIIIAPVNGQVQVAPLLRAEGSVDKVKACQLVRKGVQSPGADLAVQVPHRVQRCLADRYVIIVGALAALHIAEYIPIPVQHSAGNQDSIGIVEVTVKGRGGPLSALGKIFDKEHRHSRRQQNSQRHADHGPLFNFPHDRPPL